MRDKYKWARDEVGTLLAAKLNALPEKGSPAWALIVVSLWVWLWVSVVGGFRIVLIWVAVVVFGVCALTISPFVALYVLVDTAWMTTWFVVKAFERMRK